MGFLDRLMGGQSAIHSEWKVLKEISQLDEIVKRSGERPVVLFKHSISCGISAMSKHKLESDWDFTGEEMDFYYLDLLNHRAISNAIADRFGVIHQSPQVVLIKNGKAVYHTSHHNISVADLRKALESR